MPVTYPIWRGDWRHAAVDHHRPGLASRLSTSKVAGNGQWTYVVAAAIHLPENDPRSVPPEVDELVVKSSGTGCSMPNVPLSERALRGGIRQGHGATC